jgi:hypothetical protein
MLNRIKIVQTLIRATGAKNYLEIGVNNGACFLRIRAPYKMAVDPSFKMKAGRKLKYFFKNPSNVNNHYFELTSDDFFATQQNVLKERNPKIVLIDGLHTYKQALRDVYNSLKFLDEGGVIVMHDCNPLSEAAAYPAESIDHARTLNLPGWTNIWNGDVWKTIVHLRALNPELEVFVLDCDHGIGIVRKSPSKSRLNFSEAQVNNLSYADLQSDRVNMINLKPAEFFEEFVRQLV